MYVVISTRADISISIFCVFWSRPWFSQLEKVKTESNFFLLAAFRLWKRWKVGPWLPFHKYFFSVSFIDLSYFVLLQFRRVQTSGLEIQTGTRYKMLQYIEVKFIWRKSSSYLLHPNNFVARDKNLKRSWYNYTCNINRKNQLWIFFPLNSD